MTPPEARDLRAIIREHATRLFATRGFAGTSIREVAEACQCTKPAVYHHYGSKEALFREIVEDHLSRVRELLGASLQRDGSVRDRLHRLADDMVSECLAHPLAMRLCQRVETSPEESAPPIDTEAVREAHMNLVTNLVAQGIESGELRSELHPTEGALLVAGALSIQFELSIQTGAWDRDQIHRTIDLIFDGISAP